MSQFTKQLLEKIAAIFAEKVGTSGENAYRGVFSGPPLLILEDLLKQVIQDGGIALPASEIRLNPVLLPGGACSDPMDLVTSGKCSDSYLLKMRNCDRDKFLILLPPGHPVNESIDTTTQKLGILASDTRPAFETRFFDDMLKGAFLDNGLNNGERYVELARNVLRNEMAKLDAENTERRYQWGLLQRLYDTKYENSTEHDRVISVIGLVSCSDQELEYSKHKQVLDGLGNLLEQEGINGGFNLLKVRASAQLHEALEACKDHIKSGCKTGSDFLESPALRYAPSEDGSLPFWWKSLDLNVWKELLDEVEEPKPKDRLNVELEGVVVNPEKGHPQVVQSCVSFKIEFLEKPCYLEVTVLRRVGRKQSEILGRRILPIEGWAIVDEVPPSHSSSLEYSFVGKDEHGNEIKPVIIKVIALDSYEPGVIAYSRNSTRSKPFKLRKQKGKKKAQEGKLEYESFMEFNSIGLHQLDLYLAHGLKIDEMMQGKDVTREGGDDAECIVNRSSETHAVAVIETDEECSYTLKTHRTDGTDVMLHILLESGDEAPLSAQSEFDRLVIENQKHLSKARCGSVVTPSSERCSNLQHWILENPNSYRPLIIGPDFEKAWSLPDWSENAIISDLELIQDPRPLLTDMEPPEGFLDTRNAILHRLRLDGDGCSRLIEEVNLGALMKEEGENAFSLLLERYLDLYLKWISEDQFATWSDVILACKADPSSGSINPNPYAILLSPIHPLRLAWQCQAQVLLTDALDKQCPCPAASTLDSSMFPDCMALPFRETSGKSKGRGFLSIRSNSDYWQVLWSCDYFDDLAHPEYRTLFCRWFGITVDGIASGFSAAQVKRSIEDIRRIFPAKSQLRLLIESDSAGVSSCNDGIEAWVSENLGSSGNENGDGDPWFEAGPIRLEVFDGRDEDSQPMESQVARMGELSGGNLRWFSKHDVSKPADLAVIAHLGTANPKLESHGQRSAVGIQGLSRWRIRRQTGEGGKLISESRIGTKPRVVTGVGSQASRIATDLESKFEEIGDSYVFAPNLPRLAETSEKATYCVVSSSSLDPACFFGQTGDFFLWDYELPSFSRRAGENSGYYLLATPSPSMRRAIEEGIRMLGHRNAEEESPELVDHLLKEISSRGMPTLKRLTAGGTSALGEVGVLVALRILQGDFIEGTPTPSIAPVMDGSMGALSLVVPVDPFTQQVDALRRSLEHGSRERPDLLILTMSFDEMDEPLALRVTPVEVKTRNAIMSVDARKEALQQAIKFAEFLVKLSVEAKKTAIWGVAHKHLLCSWLDYGFRVYGQLDQFRNDVKWSIFHQKMISAILVEEIAVEIDILGRLVVIDGSKQSDYFDTFGNGLDDTLIVTHHDAEKIVRCPEQSIISKIVEKLGRWGCTVSAPKTTPATGSDFPSNVFSGGLFANESESHAGVSSPKGEYGDCVRGQPSKHDPDPLTDEDSSPIRVHQNESGVGVCFEVGTSIGGFTSRKFTFHPSNTQLNQLNIGVVGDLGTGKTQLIQGLLYNLSRSGKDNRGISPNVLIFDYKKDYSKSLFVENTGAKVIQPFKIPLNIFDTTNCTNQMNPWLERNRFFSDTMSKIFPGLGQKQRFRLKEAIKGAYEQASRNQKLAPTINDVFEKYAEACGNDIDSPYSIMSDIIDHGIFVGTHEEAIPFKEFFKGVVVINLAGLGQDDNMKNMLVAVFLGIFYEHMLKVEKRSFIGTDPKLRALDSFLLVDEADNIMRYDFEVLRKILLQGREFGVGVILASQYPSHFKAHDNYIETLRTWFIHKVPDINAKVLQSMGFTNVSDQTAQRLKGLDCHECLYRTLGLDEGTFMRGNPLFEMVDQNH